MDKNKSVQTKAITTKTVKHPVDDSRSERSTKKQKVAVQAVQEDAQVESQKKPISEAKKSSKMLETPTSETKKTLKPPKPSEISKPKLAPISKVSKVSKKPTKKRQKSKDTGYVYFALAAESHPDVRCPSARFNHSFHCKQEEARNWLNNAYWNWLTERGLPLDITEEELETRHRKHFYMAMPPFEGTLQRVWTSNAKASPLKWTFPDAETSRHEQSCRQARDVSTE
jgi:hypothetical protein